MEQLLDFFKAVAVAVSFIFVLGGIWRDVRATQRDVSALKDSVLPAIQRAQGRDHQVLVQLATQHNLNHDADIRVPQVNGGEA